MWILESTLPSTGQHRRSAMKAKRIIPLLFLIPQCVCLLSFITATQLLPGSTRTTYGIGGREREWEKKDTWMKSISPDMIAVICPCYSYWCRGCGCILHWHVTSKTKEDKWKVDYLRYFERPHHSNCNLKSNKLQFSWYLQFHTIKKEL